MVRIDRNDEKTRNILLFAGGFVAGFAFKMAIESDMFKELKNNAVDMMDNYFNNQIEYVDIDIDDSDNVDSDMEVVDLDVEVADSRIERDDIEDRVNVKID